MYHPSEKEFIRLAKKGNIIPVYKEIFADTDTPVSAYLKIKTGDYSYLLESVEGEDKIARFSFLGSEPLIVFSSKKNKITVTSYETGAGFKKKKRTVRTFLTTKSPLDELRKIMQGLHFVEQNGLPRFSGGFIGYLGYGMVRFFEPKLAEDKIKDDLKLADSYFILAENLIIFDHRRHNVKIVVNTHITQKQKINKALLKRIYSEAIGKIEKVEVKLRRNLPSSKILAKRGKHSTSFSGIKSNISKKKFKDMVRRAKEYIKKGDIIQVVLSQRFYYPIKYGSFGIYRSLRSINPSPYMFYLNFKDLSLVGSSPEMFVRCEDGLVQMRPIAGTRRRGKDKKEDASLAANLLKDKKENAEHLMLVDLGRNDLGRVCDYGSVKVNEFKHVEKYSHVMHIVSNVKGDLSKRKNVFDVVASTFPAGTVSGAPKVRAMEIIDELEGLSRGPYAGCVGYFSFSGNLDTCITIRTIVIKNKIAYIQAGAGIVADSDPEKEYYETVNKAKAQVEAIRSYESYIIDR